MLKKTSLYFRLRPIYNYLLPQSYSLLDTKPEFVNTLDEVRNSREKYETMTSEVERLQSHLSS